MLYIELIGGLVLLVIGGDALVRGSVSLAERAGVSPLLIGLTLVGFGTSSPELLTSLKAAFAGSPGIAVGNVVGSNIANILLILGVGALIFPIATSKGALTRDGTVVMLATLACVGLAVLGHVGRLAGLALFAALIAYLVYTYLTERGHPDAAAKLHADEVQLAKPAPMRTWLALAFTVGGFAMILLGANFLVTSAIALAALAGVSEAIIGVTVVAIGTSLPELAATVAASLRRHNDVAFGSIVGSNIFNLLGILGVTAAVHPIDIPPEIVALDIWVMLAATLVMLIFAVTSWRVNRIEGALFVLAYAGYIAVVAPGLGSS